MGLQVLLMLNGGLGELVFARSESLDSTKTRGLRRVRVSSRFL